MDIVFAIMHLNIQKCTVTLLSDLLPMTLLNKTQYVSNWLDFFEYFHFGFFIHLFSLCHWNRKFKLIEPQLSVLARLCVYSIMSSLEKNATKAKRSLNGSESSDGERPAKMRKIEDSLLDILTDGQEKSEIGSNGDNEKSASSTIKIHEPLKSCLYDLFQTLYQLTFSSEATPKVLFVHQFLTYLHRCGGEKIRPVLNLMPNGLMKNLLKITNGTSFNYDFILR